MKTVLYTNKAKNLIKRIYLSEVCSLINRKDIRSVHTWCEKNQLKIYKDSSGEFVYENDLYLVSDMPLIKDLKFKYGDDWLVFYKAYKNDELYTMLDLDATNKTEKVSYVPKGELSSDLFGKPEK